MRGTVRRERLVKELATTIRVEARNRLARAKTCLLSPALDYAAILVAESESDCPPSVGGECPLGTDVLEDRQEDFECFAAAVPQLVSMLIAPEGDPNAPDIPTPRSYAEAITGVDFFYTFSPTPKMTTLRVLLHVAAERDYELHSLDFSIAFLQGSLHEEIWLRRPPGFTGSFPTGTQWSLRWVVYGLCKGPREWHDTLRTTLVALGFAPSTADPSLFLCTDTSLPPFYVLVYVLQRFGFRYSLPQSTPLPTGHSLSAPPSNESVEPSGPYPELVGCLMYLMTCTRPDLAYPLSILARYVAPRRHQPEHWEAAKRMLRYLCSTSGMGHMLRGRGPVVLTGHEDASWVNDLATQWSSQGYTFSLGSCSVSWRSTCSSSVLSSSCEAEIYAGSMAAQELRWLTYVLSDLGERPCSSRVLYVDNKGMIALCQEHRLEHKTKHIALCYFFARELQQRGQLRLAYVAIWANTAVIFTKALQSACFAFLDWSCDLFFSPTLPMGEPAGEEAPGRAAARAGAQQGGAAAGRPSRCARRQGRAAGAAAKLSHAFDINEVTYVALLLPSKRCHPSYYCLLHPHPYALALLCCPPVPPLCYATPHRPPISPHALTAPTAGAAAERCVWHQRGGLCGAARGSTP
ncbi:unnamed protein product [Closterium sp. NIES-53]